MSDQYVRRLGRIRDEYQAAFGALSYAIQHWHSASLFNAPNLDAVSLQDVQRAADDLEDTYLIRLFSAFEGILKEHLAKNHPQVSIAEDASAASLIDRVSRLNRRLVHAPLRQRVHSVRQHRNFLVHPGGAQPVSFTLPMALAPLSRFVDKLPAPPS